MLLDASAHAYRITALLAGQRAYFDFHNILADVQGLQDRIERAYSLMCTVPRLEGIKLEAGIDLAALRRRFNVRRAQIVDAELVPMRRAPSSDAPTWSIDYRSHGGFIATSKPVEGTRPWRFWGMAPTAAFAAHTLSWYFLDQPPHITFDPPQGESQPYVCMTSDSDLSTEGSRVCELLDQRGSSYDEHLAACEVAWEVLAHWDDIADHLTKRASELNVTDPQLQRPYELLKPGNEDNCDHGGFAETVRWVPIHLVVATNHPSWGDFGGHRDQAPFDIVEGLLSSDLETFT